MILPVSHIVVGVADMRAVHALWREQFGLERVAERKGSDADLERLWALPSAGVSDQLLLRTPGQSHGWLHFVEFSQPGTAVREHAAATDLCPKNIDMCCADLPARVRQLESAGYSFRSAISERDADGLAVREVQMPAHDAINVVLIEVPDWPMPMSAKQFGGVTAFVTTVPDTAAEAAFYAGVFGHDELIHHRITGPDIEAVVGLPPGAALDMRVTGDADSYLGRMEMVCYEGVNSRNLHPAARAPATGSLAARIQVADITAIQERARAAGLNVRDAGTVELLFGRCHVLQLESPAGFRVEAFQLLD